MILIVTLQAILFSWNVGMELVNGFSTSKIKSISVHLQLIVYHQILIHQLLKGHFCLPYYQISTFPAMVHCGKYLQMFLFGLVTCKLAKSFGSPCIYGNHI